MITEDYVSFEVAKLLKEKRFEGFCEYRYIFEPDYSKPVFAKKPLGYGTQDKYLFDAPTLQMAMKWLREVHHIFISIDYVRLAHNSFEYTYEVHNMNKGRSIIISEFRNDFETYEDVINEAIIKSLIYV